MMIRVIVEICVKIENFKSISMHVFIQSLLRERVGDFLQGKKYTEGTSLCSTSERFFRLIVIKERPGLNNTAVRHVLIL